jgi:hypothetical protein
MVYGKCGWPWTVVCQQGGWTLDMIFANPEASTWIAVTHEGVSEGIMCAVPLSLTHTHTHTQLVSLQFVTSAVTFQLIPLHNTLCVSGYLEHVLGILHFHLKYCLLMRQILKRTLHCQWREFSPNVWGGIVGDRLSMMIVMWETLHIFV